MDVSMHQCAVSPATVRHSQEGINRNKSGHDLKIYFIYLFIEGGVNFDA